jgi:hypothetical protein
LPTPDGGGGGGGGHEGEVVAARFVHPRDALAEHRAREIALMPPQHYILSTLADILVGREATAQQRERVEQLSAGAFGRMVVCPRVGKVDASGRTPFVFEGDEARGGPKCRLHRSLVLFDPETKVSSVFFGTIWCVCFERTLRVGDVQLPAEVELLRNFDIFTEVGGGAAVESTKL